MAAVARVPVIASACMLFPGRSGRSAVHIAGVAVIAPFWTAALGTARRV